MYRHAPVAWAIALALSTRFARPQDPEHRLGWYATVDISRSCSGATGGDLNSAISSQQSRASTPQADTTEYFICLSRADARQDQHCLPDWPSVCRW
jgi:hypothetical protein